MNQRRYDDVVRLVASVLFGTSFRQLHDVFKSLNSLTGSESLATFTTITFYLVFFRNVHGLISYDTWADNSQYKPAFEEKPRHLVWHFVFGLFGAIISPYLFIYFLTVGPNNGTIIFTPWGIAAFLILPMFVYFPWNYFWLLILNSNPLPPPDKPTKPYSRHTFIKRLCYVLRRCIAGTCGIPKRLNAPAFSVMRTFSAIRSCLLSSTKHLLNGHPRLYLKPKAPLDNTIEERNAYVELLDFTILWLMIDIFWMTTFCLWFICMFIWGGCSVAAICYMYSTTAFVALLVDYCSHICYYFPRPSPSPYRRETDMEVKFYQFQEPWHYVLPDGLQFCHWGGKAMSQRLVAMLDINVEDHVLELCCGQGGSLSLLPPAQQIVAIDISHVNIEKAKNHLKDKPIVFWEGDVVDMLSEKAADGQFDKVLSQDGDAWMHPSKHVIMSEIFRAMAKGGTFIYQSYVASNTMPEHASKRTERLLHQCGYANADVPRLEEMPRMFQVAGFRMESMELLHQIYLEDNRQMLERFEKNREILLRRFPTLKAKAEIDTLGKWLEWCKILFFEGWWSGILIVARKD